MPVSRSKRWMFLEFHEFEVFCEEKVERVAGQLAHGLALNWGEASEERVTENREFLFNFFSEVVWSIDDNCWNYGNRRTTQRIVFLCFYRSFGVVLKRLVESSLLQPECFRGVVVVSLPFVDPIHCAAPKSQSHLEHVTLNAFCAYLRQLFVLVVPPLAFPSSSTSRTEGVLEKRIISDDYWMVRIDDDAQSWMVGRVVRGSKRRRKQKREYFGNVTNRLENYGCGVWGRKSWCRAHGNAVPQLY